MTPEETTNFNNRLAAIGLSADFIQQRADKAMIERTFRSASEMFAPLLSGYRHD
ncbi:hypothetical protein L2091_01865 [Curtobacterium albidum]|uniref:hypothetical protein n=1 Tax=Curtobacterium citreum TaxID=2036 RepID=UPI000AC3A58D|nr:MULTISPECIES: hypothetical protein [Curtobacterium]MCL9663976.1 hypothetical protein [Curtobacterium albidum]